MPRLAAFRTAASAGLGLAGASVATFLLSSCGSPGGPVDRARRALEDGRTHEAWTLAGEAVAAEPNSAEAWVCRARAGLRTFRTAEAMAAADRAIALDSLRADAHLTRAYIFQRQFRNVAANKCADRAAELAPGEVRMHVARGELHLGGGVVGTADYDVATAAFREALRLDARSPRARLGLARTLVAQAQDDEAMTILDGLLADRPFHGEGHYLRGVVRMRNREMERAAVDFERAVRYLADPAPARFNLARVLDRLGKSEQALAARGDYPQARLRAEEINFARGRFHSEQPF